MASRVHHLTASATGGVLPEPNLLDLCRQLWAPQDLAGIESAAAGLIGHLFPGIRTRLTKPGKAESDSHDRALRLPLDSDYQLELRPAPAGADHDCLLQAAARLIDLRLSALSQHEELTASVLRLEQAERLQRALYAIADQASANQDVNQTLHALHQIVADLMYAENFYIVLYDGQRDTIRFAYFADVADPDPPDPNFDQPMDEIRYGPTWYLIRKGEPLMGPLDQIAAQVGGPYRGTGPESVDWLGVPLLRGDQVVGGVVVQSYTENARYSERDKALLIYVAQHIQTALERRFAHAELERRVDERTEALREANRVLQQQVLERQRGERLQAALFRIAELANTTDSIDDFYAAVHRVVGGLLYARNFYIALLSEDQSELTFPYSVDERDPERHTRKLANGLTEYVLSHGAALLANTEDILRMRERGDVAQHGTDSVCWLGVPLVCSERTAGALVVQSYSPEHRYTLRDQELLTFVSYHIANALERVRAAESLKAAYAGLERRVGERTRALALANRDLREQIAERERVEARLKYETLHDSLTGLPNRSLLMQRLEQAIEQYHADPTRLFAVLFLDLDRFKVINDSVGHLIGDDLLFQAGGRVRACLKSQDVVARLGGDEFGVLLEDVGDAQSACHVAGRIINELNAPFRLAAKELFTSTSIGIAIAAPQYRRPEELLRDADSAMYRAKAEGRHRYALFDEGLRQQALTLLEVENDLRRGLTRSEFEPHYQPIVQLASGETIGYEALMRWRHPQRGLLLPGEFLTVAEESGLSEAIDWQIFEQVFSQGPALTANNRFISINLSGRHFRSEDLDRRLLGLLARHGLPAHRVRIEVTERALLENPSDVKRTLQTLRSHGISVALDDFGTGYSSLSYVHQYPLQALKIDQSFVASLAEGDGGGSVAVVRAILALADTLSMQVIAEGIETEVQREVLRKLGCECGQGFLFARAQPAETWLNAMV
jgi:diguanylate cyclase (GGDEF)-like protein